MSGAESNELRDALRDTVRALEQMTREVSHMLAHSQSKPPPVQEVRRVLTVAAHMLAQIGKRMDHELPLPPPDRDL